jgi:hypothetical protein
MDVVKEFAGPVVTLLSAGAGVAKSFMDKPSMPKLDGPAPVKTPVMPARDDATARSAALKAIAKRSSQHGRNSTKLYEHETLG